MSLAKLKEMKQNASTRLQKASSAVGLQQKFSALEMQPSTESEESESSIASGSALEELSDMCPKLTFQQRVIGFGTCYGLGYLITFSSFKFFIRLMEGNPLPFVIMYTTGNILSLLSSTFLCGPKRQLKNMFDKNRHITSIVYLSTMFLTVIVALIPFEAMIKLSILVLLLIAQICASLWYSLSYIPFGRRTAKRFLRNTLGLEEGEV